MTDEDLAAARACGRKRFGVANNEKNKPLLELRGKTSYSSKQSGLGLRCMASKVRAKPSLLCTHGTLSREST